MTNWKNLHSNPPMDNCDICVKVGTSYDTFKFKHDSKNQWILTRGMMEIEPYQVPGDAKYIVLNDIK